MGRRCWGASGLARGRHIITLVASSVTIILAAAVRYHFLDVRAIRFALSYTWQFYLPPLPGMTDVLGPGAIDATTVWLQEGSGWFGWLAIRVPGRAADLEIHATEAFAALIIVCALIWARRDARLRGLMLSSAVATVAYVLALHMAEYSTFRDGGTQILQARYLLPVLPLCAAGSAAVLDRTPVRAVAPVAVAVLMASWLAADVVGLGTVVDAFVS